MRTPRSGRTGQSLLLAFVLVLTLGLPLGGLGGGATAAPGRGDDATAPTSSPAPTRSEARVTLLTGDVVAWQQAPNGKQGASVVVPAVKGAPPALVYEQDGQAYVVPAEALPYVQSGALDESLFNVSLLVSSGLDDGSTDQVPLLLQGRGGAETRRAPSTPEAADKVQALDSVGMVAVEGAKDEIRDVWESLRGDQAELTATDAQLAGAGKVWLDGRVQATLDDSVPQIGAPEAWARPATTARASRSPCSTPASTPTTPTSRARSPSAANFTGTAEPASTTTATAPTSPPPSPAPAPPPAASTRAWPPAPSC